MIWGGYDYLRDTLLGRTKPNRVSWSLWALAPLISLGAAFSAGADIWASVRVIVGGIVPVPFFASFINRNSYWRLNGFDWFCGALSLAALIFWQLADSPLLAVLLASAANTLASVPTFVKAWNFPETESRLIFINSFVSAIIIIPAIPEWTVANSAFQIQPDGDDGSYGHRHLQKIAWHLISVAGLWTPMMLGADGPPHFSAAHTGD